MTPSVRITVMNAESSSCLIGKMKERKLSINGTFQNRLIAVKFVVSIITREY